MYDIKKSINRFNWRFRKDDNGNFFNFKPTNEDVKCMNTLISWIIREKKEDLQNNQLFAKLYIYFLHQQIREHNTTVLDSIPQKQLSKLLDKPIHSFYEAFTKELHDNQICKLLEGVTRENKKLTPEMLRKAYDLEYVTNSLNGMITEALNRFSIK